MPVVLGFDLGTSSVRCLILDTDSGHSSLGQVDYQFDIPRIGWAEQEAESWWEASKKALKIALAKGPFHASEIEAISFSGQMHGLVCMNSERKAVRPAIIWCDQRTTELVERMNTEANCDLMRKTTLNRVFTGFALASLKWLQENEADHYRQIVQIGCPKDYLRFRLCGKWGMEQTDASSTSAYDAVHGKWCDELIEGFGLDPSIFPPLSLSTDFAGTVRPEVCRELGLSPDCAVYFGGSDQVMQAIGNGIIEPGSLSVTIGTGGQVLSILSEARCHPSLNAHTFQFVSPELWYFLGASLSAGQSLRWLRHNVLAGISYAEMNELAKTKPCGSEGLLFLPYLIGERSPHADPRACGCFFGLRLKHDRGNLIRSVMEGVVFSLKDCLNLAADIGVKPQIIVASGGGAQSQLWQQILADILEIPVTVSKNSEQAALGAAISAAVAHGIYPSFKNACQELVHWQKKNTDPNIAKQKIYRESYAIYRDLYLNNKDSMHQLFRLSASDFSER